MSLSADGKTLMDSGRRTQSDIWMMSVVPAAGRP
jgi:hypothetical protein